MNKLVSAAAAVLLLALAGSASAAVVNPGFEDSGAITVSGSTLGLQGTPVNGWNLWNNTAVLTTANETSPGTDVFAPGGAHMLEINTTGLNNGVYQFPSAGFGRVTADFYVLSGVAQLYSALNGATVGSPTATTALNVWQRLTVNAAGANEIALYSGLGGAHFYVDNITVGDFVVTEPANSVVTAPTGGVPEPATWALMMIGFGAAGSMIRRRKAVLA